MAKQPRFMEQVRQKIRFKHYSHRTEQAYLSWIRRFILFHNKRHPKDMGASEAEAFLTHLACDRHVASSTQNQTLCAILFLYREVLQLGLPWVENFTPTKHPRRLPVVMTKDEVAAVLARIEGRYWLMTSLLYGAGLRLMECVCLRVKDIEFTRREIIVRSGKGRKDRVTMLPDSLVEPLRRQLTYAQSIHEQDLQEGYGEVYISCTSAQQYPGTAEARTEREPRHP